MSLIKRYLENLATMTTDALCDECSRVDPYYGNHDRNEIEEDVMNEFTDGNYDDSFGEMLACIGDFDEDLVAEFPKTFSAICALLPLVESRNLRYWEEIISAASQPEIYKALVESYKEYMDMSDPPVSDAKEWIRGIIHRGDYAGVLEDLNAVIEDYELEESDSPITFRTKRMLESMIS